MSKSKQIGYLGEKRIADYLGLTRFGATGMDNTDLVSQDGRLLVEVKAGKQIPALVVKALSQVVNHANKLDYDVLPVVAMVPKGVGEAKLEEEALIIMRLGDFSNLLNENISYSAIPETLTVTTDSGEQYLFRKET